MAAYPRTYIDVNRAETDIDAELLSEPWPGPLEPNEKTRRGLGLIRRYVEPGVEINLRRLAPAEVAARIEGIYHPYHAALAALVEEIARGARRRLARELALDEVGGQRHDTGRAGRAAARLRRVGP